MPVKISLQIKRVWEISHREVTTGLGFGDLPKKCPFGDVLPR